MKYFKISLLGLLVATAAAQADEFSVGAGLLVTPNPYVGSQDQVFPVPVLGYEGDYGYFRGLGGGVYLWNDDRNTLSINAYYSPLHYRPGDSDDAAMKLLNKRRATLMAGMGYRYKDPIWGQIRLELAGDTLNNSNGMIGDLGYLYPISSGDWRISPGVGVTWASANHNRYYYGVSATESERSGLAQYQPDNSWTPYAELAVNYQINDNWRTFFIARAVALPSEVKNSPMVNNNFTGSLMTGVSYVF